MSEQTDPRDVLVVGGGISGLSAAFELSEDPGVRVTLIEADPFRSTAPPEKLLSAGEWVQLQQICAR